MKRIFLTLFAGLFLAGSLQAKLNVVATLPDLGALASEVGGNLVKVTSLAQSTEDPHFVDAKPSFVVLLNKADLLIEGGAELEVGWLPPLVQSARNAKIAPGGKGHLKASEGVPLRDLPTGPIDRSQGDVHAAGNPHYLLDPANAVIVTRHIAEVMARLDSANAAAYQENARKLIAHLEQKQAEWKTSMAPYQGAKVVTYHSSYNYLLNRFGLVLSNTIEPKPGIEPSPTHINGLISSLKGQGIKLVIIEPNRSPKTPQYVAHELNAKLLALPIMPPTSDYIQWYDSLVRQLQTSLRE